MSTANKIETTVSEFLERASVKMHTSLLGETTRDDKWKCDEWRVRIVCKAADYTIPFYQGIGHRTKPKHSYATQRPIAPTAATVFHSLLLDGAAIDESFSDWCANYGYDEDSRKALQTYEACCECGRKLRKLFTAKQREQLQTILQDY